MSVGSAGVHWSEASIAGGHQTSVFQWNTLHECGRHRWTVWVRPMGAHQGCPLSPTLSGRLLDGLHDHLLRCSPGGPQGCSSCWTACMDIISAWACAWSSATPMQKLLFSTAWALPALGGLAVRSFCNLPASSVLAQSSKSLAACHMHFNGWPRMRWVPVRSCGQILQASCVNGPFP